MAAAAAASAASTSVTFLLMGSFCLALWSQSIFAVDAAPVVAVPVNIAGKGETIARHKDIALEKLPLNPSKDVSKPAATQPRQSEGKQEKEEEKEYQAGGIVATPIQTQTETKTEIEDDAQKEKKAGGHSRRKMEVKSKEEKQPSFIEDDDNKSFLMDVADAASSPSDNEQLDLQYLLQSDPRLRDRLTGYDNNRQRLDADVSSLDVLPPRALAEYLITTGNFNGFENTIEDLIAVGLMTREEAMLYKDAVAAEYESILMNNVISNDEIQQAIEPSLSSDGAYYESNLDQRRPDIQSIRDDSSRFESIPVDYPDYANFAKDPEPMDYYGQTSSRNVDGDVTIPEERVSNEETDQLLQDLLESIYLQAQEEKDDQKAALTSEGQEEGLPIVAAAPVKPQKLDRNGSSNLDKELESLTSTTGTKDVGSKATKTSEEMQLEEMRNRVRPGKSSKDANRTKPVKLVRPSIPEGGRQQ